MCNSVKSAAGRLQRLSVPQLIHRLPENDVEAEVNFKCSLKSLDGKLILKQKKKRKQLLK